MKWIEFVVSSNSKSVLVREDDIEDFSCNCSDKDQCDTTIVTTIDGRKNIIVNTFNDMIKQLDTHRS